MYEPNAGLLNRIFLIGGLMVVLAVGCFLLYVQSEGRVEGATQGMARQFVHFTRFKTAEPLPSLRLAGPDGNEAKLEAFRGKYILLNFWATWCAPCVKELPSLQALSDNYKRPDFVIMAVSVDDPSRIDQIPGFLRRIRVRDVANWSDYRADLQTAFAFNALPVTYLIDPQGRVLYEMSGPAEWNSPSVIAFLNQFH